jgi:hypothetical protein
MVMAWTPDPGDSRVAHYPPTVARGPMALALRLVRNEIIIIILTKATTTVDEVDGIGRLATY